MLASGEGVDCKLRRPDRDRPEVVEDGVPHLVRVRVRVRDRVKLRVELRFRVRFRRGVRVRVRP